MSTVTMTEVVDGIAVGTTALVVEVSSGSRGPQGPAGADGATGATGATGAQGDPGVGVPVGGTTGQVLAKATATDYDTAWVDQTGGTTGGTVDSVIAGTGISVDSTDPANPIVANTGATAAQGALADTALQPADVGTAATHAATDFATTAQGALADSATQPGDLGTAATKDIPAAGDATATQVVYGTDTRLTNARTPTAHTHTEADVTGLTTDLAGKVPTTRTVTAGTGLTGGGDLSANRTLAVSYGTAAGTAAQGNDSRLSDARTPTAHASTHAAAGADAVALDASQVTRTTNAQTGTTYTLVLADASKFVTLTNASAITLTVPPNSSAAFPVGTEIILAQLGAGQVTITAGSGVTVNSSPGLKVAAQYGTAALKKTATDVWLAFGRLSA